jgi:thiamine-phosphate pyrophosphorylase
MSVGAETLRKRISRLSEAARRLNKRSGCRGPGFQLAYFTDPRRGPNPELVARLGGPGLAIVYRNYDDIKRAAGAKRLAQICRRSGVALYISADETLAVSAGAQGVHWPSWMTRRPDKSIWTGAISMACHNRQEIARAVRWGADCAFLSPVFQTASHADAQAWGPDTFQKLAMKTDLPILALGGVDETNAHLVSGRNIVGFGAVGAFASATKRI